MSVWATIDTAEQDRLIEAQNLTIQNQAPVILPDDQVGFGEGLGRGVVSGAVRVGSAMDMAAGGLAVGIDAITGGTELQDLVFSEHDETFGRAKKALTPRAEEVTTAGQIAFGLSQALTELAAGGPSTLVATEQLNAAEDLVAQGVDSTTAQGAGLITGTANAIGVALPGAVGTTLAAKLASGAGINVVAGAAAEGGQKVLLEQRGYQELADQIDPLDLKARSIDAILGAAFGGMAHLGVPEAAPAERNSAATLNLAAQAEAAAPGRPADIQAETAHAMAFEKAQDDLMSGRPVDVAAELEGATFAPDPRREAMNTEVGKAVEEAVLEVRTTDPDRFLTPDQVQAAEHEQLLRDQMRIVGIEATEAQVKALAKGTDLGALRDEVTGLYEARVSIQGKNARITAIERLLKLAEDTGADSTYIHADIQNLGGLNKQLNEVGANKVFKAFSEFLDDEARKIAGARAVSFRHGGDEISAVVLNADPAAADRAMQAAARRAREYAAGITTEKGDNLMQIPHAKDPTNEAKRGTGVTFASSRIVPGLKPSEIIEQAAKKLEDMKDVRPEQSPGTGAGRVDAGAAPRATGSDSGTLGRGGDGVARGEGQEVPQSAEALPDGVAPETLRAVEQALLEDPTVPAIDETTGQHVPAGELLAKIDQEIQEAARRRDAVLAAAACFLRNGGV